MNVKRVFRFIHNAIIHPLMEVLPESVGDTLHDLTADIAFKNKPLDVVLNKILYQYTGYRVTMRDDRTCATFRVWSDTDVDKWVAFEYGKVWNPEIGFGYTDDDEQERHYKFLTPFGWFFLSHPVDNRDEKVTESDSFNFTSRFELATILNVDGLYPELFFRYEHNETEYFGNILPKILGKTLHDKIKNHYINGKVQKGVTEWTRNQTTLHHFNRGSLPW